MSVQFEDQQNTYTVSKQKGLTEIVINAGLAKDAKGAQVVLLVIAVVAVGIGLFFMFGIGGPQVEEDFTISPEESVGSQQGLPPQ